MPWKRRRCAWEIWRQAGYTNNTSRIPNSALIPFFGALGSPINPFQQKRGTLFNPRLLGNLDFYLDLKNPLAPGAWALDPAVPQERGAGEPNPFKHARIKIGIHKSIFLPNIYIYIYKCIVIYNSI